MIFNLNTESDGVSDEAHSLCSVLDTLVVNREPQSTTLGGRFPGFRSKAEITPETSREGNRGFIFSILYINFIIYFILLYCIFITFKYYIFYYILFIF